MILAFFRDHWIQLISTVVGTVGFCLYFNIKRDKLLYGLIGGIIAIVTLFICDDLGMPLLIQNMTASMFGTLYSEIIARVVKAPATVFIISSIIPLTPGGSLYYTMSAFVDGNTKEFQTTAAKTGIVALGIALGIVIVSVIFYQIYHRDVRQKVNYQKYVKENKKW